MANSPDKPKADVLNEKPHGKKTPARVGKSTPATQLAMKKAKTGVDRLNEVAMTEEKTAQKVLDLKKAKAKGQMDKDLAKIQAKVDLKMQQNKLKAELMAKKLDMEAKRMEQEHQLRMAQMGYFMGQAAPGDGIPQAHNTFASNSAVSESGSATPSDGLGMGLGLDNFDFSSIGNYGN